MVAVPLRTTSPVPSAFTPTATRELPAPLKTLITPLTGCWKNLWVPIKSKRPVLGVIGSLDKPASPAGEAMQAFHGELNGRNKDSIVQFRNRVLAVTDEDLKRVASTYLRQEKAQTAVITNSDLAAKTGLNIIAV